MSSSPITAAIDLGGTTIKIALLQGDQVLGMEKIPAHSNGALADRLCDIETAIFGLIGRFNAVEGVAVAFPSIVDASRNRPLTTNAKFDDALSLDLGAWVQNTFEVPFLMENDANAALVGECRKGCARGQDNAVLFILGTGVGTAAYINGQLLRGAHYQAGVLGGHFKTGVPGVPCSCGTTGCLEAMVGTWALPLRSAGRYPHYEALLNACRTGDAHALAWLDDTVDYWARGISTLAAAYDPEVIILSGGVMLGRDLFAQRLQEKVQALSWLPWGELKFLFPDAPDQSVLLGLHALMEDKLK